MTVEITFHSDKGPLGISHTKIIMVKECSVDEYQFLRIQSQVNNNIETFHFDLSTICKYVIVREKIN